ncbi:uncharacterized protein LOC110661260 isoform X2 [Hevea brasiliensis]|uniref:uncharacterized protein LOC110661260 isoform X2 n=1 Tax=Hevea brasiliensis TaxID=3981 RepID=UPI000B7875B6|nr:uncharacterized protein LOC110661260 isoform X2 [Hevea brasiliensis]
MEMEQLLSMGFPSELAAQALAATGGKSTLKATEWILSHKSCDANPKPPSNPTPSSLQPKLDRFFHLQSKPNSSSSSPCTPPPTDQAEDEPIPLCSKRPKLLASSATNSCSPAIHHSKHHPPHEPLSERMRPRSIDDVVGQDHLLAQNSILRSAIDYNRLPSIILWGPPGTVTCGVKDVRDAVENARKLKVKNGKRTVLFVDEIHRFNKSQQDSFLPVIEDGSIVFIGATTENPSFHLITPLLSRCRLLTLCPLKPQHIQTILNRAINHSCRGLTQSLGVRVEVTEDAIRFISENCDGDARVALNALEISAITASARTNPNDNFSLVANVTLDDAKETFQFKHLAYDKAGEEHYNLISALHKSMRGSDADASIYWLARMLEGGEQPLYIARRLIRFASEDVGLADPLALNQAVACYQACHFLGMPECNVILAQCVAYLALAPKSIAVYQAIEAAQKVVRESTGQNEGVPLHLRNAPTKVMKELGYGKGYIYTPDNPSSTQTYLPSSLEAYKFLDWPASNVNDWREAI